MVIAPPRPDPDAEDEDEDEEYHQAASVLQELAEVLEDLSKLEVSHVQNGKIK